MSVPCEEIRPELEALLAAMTDGRLDAEGKRRLSTILREHPDARQFYLDYCQMHALLTSAHGVLQALEAPSTVRRRRLAGAGAAAVLLLGLAGAYGFLRPAPRIDASAATLQGHTYVVRAGVRQPISDTLGLRVGDRLVTDANARSVVRLGDGTTITLLESTEAEIGPRVQLKEGTLRCEVTPQAKPLVFQTPNAEATVLGTVFELSAGWKETRLSTTVGHVRLSADGRSVDVKAGQVGVAGAQGVVRWDSVCALDFRTLKELPSQMAPMFCKSDIIHTPARKIVEDAGRVTLIEGGLKLGSDSAQNGLTDLQWKDEVGEDLIVELEVRAGAKWGLGVGMSGSGFEGYRVFFAAIDDYPNGVAIDTIWPQDCIILARDPRPIDYREDHTLRIERRGGKIRVWVDAQIRIDTEITHPLGDKRRRVFSLCNFGSAPTIRTMKVWKAAP